MTITHNQLPKRSLVDCSIYHSNFKATILIMPPSLCCCRHINQSYNSHVTGVKCELGGSFFLVDPQRMKYCSKNSEGRLKHLPLSLFSSKVPLTTPLGNISRKRPLMMILILSTVPAAMDDGFADLAFLFEESLISSICLCGEYIGAIVTTLTITITSTKSNFIHDKLFTMTSGHGNNLFSNAYHQHPITTPDDTKKLAVIILKKNFKNFTQQKGGKNFQIFSQPRRRLKREINSYREFFFTNEHFIIFLSCSHFHSVCSL